MLGIGKHASDLRAEHPVRAEGFEPSRSLEHRHLKPACLPFHHARKLHEPTAQLVDESVGGHSERRFVAAAKGTQQMRSLEEFEAIQRLVAIGLNNCVIARQTGIPRRTVLDWRRRPALRAKLPAASSNCGIDHDLPALPPAAYCCLLGLYLGDGCITRNRRVWQLRITLDCRYPGIINRCREAIDILMPRQRAATLIRSDHCTEVSLNQTLAVSISAAWSRQEAFEADPAGALAGSTRERGHRGIRSQSDP
jgi:hypothetical protein